MSKMRDVLRSLRFIGVLQALRSVRYAAERDRLDRRWTKRRGDEAEAQPPGSLLSRRPLAHGALFKFEHAELEVIFLAPELLRISWTPGDPPVPYAIKGSTWPGDRVTSIPSGGGIQLQGSALTLIVGEEGALRYESPVLALAREEEAPLRQGGGWRHRALLPAHAGVFGMGERAAPLNLRGGTYQLWNTDPGGSYGPGDDPLYLCIPLYLCLHSEGQHLLFYENSWPGWMRFDDYATAHFTGGMLRYYLIAGTLPEIYERYAQLTGRPPMPPRWALGFHQSRYSYRSEAEVRDVAAGFKRHDLPLSAIHLDIHHMQDYRVFSVNRKRFPNFEAMAANLAQDGVHLIAIVDPGVKIDANDPVWRSGKAADAFCKLPNGRPLRGLVWPGWAHFPDFTDRKAREWWGRQYDRLLSLGVDGIWHDMNEPGCFAAWGDLSLPLVTHHALDGQRGDHRQAHNLYGLTMNKAGYHALRLLQPDRRPFLLTRSGWAGVQRYAWVWTGDCESTWPQLRQTVRTLLGLSLSGIPFAGSDIGGFSGSPSAELFTRWFQLATLTPFFRVHSALGTPRREPWMFDEETLAAVRAALLFRQRLMPYLYSLAYAASQTGEPIMRPMLWEDPHNPDLWAIDDQFMLGERLLVAPILDQGKQARRVWFPEGLWLDYWTGERFHGPTEADVQAALNTSPLFLRAPAIMPLMEGDGLALHLFLGGSGVAEFDLFSDAGDGHGPERHDRFTLQGKEREWELRWDEEGDFPFNSRTLTLRLHGEKVTRIIVDKGEPMPAQTPLVLEPFHLARMYENG